MKKVLIVSGSLPPIRCGVGDYTARLSRELAAEKLNFELLSTEGVDKDTPAPVLTVPDWRIRSLPIILSAIDKSGAGIVHIEYPAVGYRRQLGINLLPYALRLTRRRLKVVLTLHEYHQSRWIGRWRNRLTVRPAHKIIVSNQPDAAALKSLAGKVSIIPIGANFDTAPQRPQYYKKVMATVDLDPTRPTLVFFGYAFPAKKLESLLDALNLPGLGDYQALLVGGFNDGSAYQRKLKQKIDELNKNQARVGLTGFLKGSDVSAIMQECSYFVMPGIQSLSAKSSTAITAIQNGMVVISKGSANKEDTAPFVHLKNCYLLAESSPDPIAQAISELEAEPAKLSTIRHGTEQLKRYFSWPHIADEHLKLYKGL